jgi:hypothetical protein
MVPFYDSPTSSCAHNMGIQFIKIVSDIGHMTRTILQVVRPYSLS